MVVAAVAIGFIVLRTTYDEGNQIANNVVGTTTSIYGADGSKLNP